MGGGSQLELEDTVISKTEKFPAQEAHGSPSEGHTQTPAQSCPAMHRDPSPALCEWVGVSGKQRGEDGEESSVVLWVFPSARVKKKKKKK